MPPRFKETFRWKCSPDFAPFNISLPRRAMLCRRRIFIAPRVFLLIQDVTMFQTLCDITMPDSIALRELKPMS
eukprot:6478251-Amphidinium_carterae.2